MPVAATMSAFGGKADIIPFAIPAWCLENTSKQLIRRATAGDVARIVEIARAAYIKYVPRIGREPPPMLADFPAEIAAGLLVALVLAVQRLARALCSGNSSESALVKPVRDEMSMRS